MVPQAVSGQHELLVVRVQSDPLDLRLRLDIGEGFEVVKLRCASELRVLQAEVAKSVRRHQHVFDLASVGVFAVHDVFFVGVFSLESVLFRSFVSVQLVSHNIGTVVRDR